MSRLESLSDRVFAAVWAGPWTAFRLGFVAAAALTHGPRVLAIRDAYASGDLLLSTSRFEMVRAVEQRPDLAFLAWALAMAGLVALAVGGRLTRPGLVLFLVPFWVLLSAESVNIKAYDHLLTWEALALFLGPAGERGLTKKWRSPVGRWVLLVVFCGLYAATGWSKAVLSPDGWWSGENLAYALLDPHFGDRVVGVWLSGFAPVMQVLAWATVAFEIGFPLLVLHRRTNPYVIAAGLAFHLGTAITMHIGTFPWVSLCAYPVLLHPDVAWALRERFVVWRRHS